MELITKPLSKTKTFTFFVGIDVSKNELDFSLLKQKQFICHEEIPNEVDLIILFVKKLEETYGDLKLPGLCSVLRTQAFTVIIFIRL